jgi:hypothetical protein
MILLYHLHLEKGRTTLLASFIANIAWVFEELSPLFIYLELKTITRCFDFAGMPVNYDIHLEIEVKDYLHPKTGSKIDLAATIDLGTRILPILFVEAGKETVPEGYLHKDKSKIQSLLSLWSYTMAYELIKINKNPELAFTFEILIGGYGCQLLIGRPVLRELVTGTFEIYVNITITYHDHWKFDIFEGPNTFPGCINSCCYLNLDASDASDASENSVTSLQFN